jgi:hypothetical protein
LKLYAILTQPGTVQGPKGKRKRRSTLSKIIDPEQDPAQKIDKVVREPSASRPLRRSVRLHSSSNSIQPRDHFRYTDFLKEGEIRLLKALTDPRESVAGDLMKFSLTTASIEKTDIESRPVLTEYNALSYVWGDESNKKQIVVNEAIFYVTENLHAALTHLRTVTVLEWIYISLESVEGKM